MACPRRCAGGHDDLEGLVIVKVLVQEKKRVVAGDRRGGKVLRDSSGSLIYCTKGRNEDVTRCARKWGRWLGPRGGAETFGGVGIGGRRQRRLRIPTRNLVRLGRFSRARGKGSEGGDAGLFIAGVPCRGG
jgi:hypothetical protein